MPYYLAPFGEYFDDFFLGFLSKSTFCFLVFYGFSLDSLRAFYGSSGFLWFSGFWELLVIFTTKIKHLKHLKQQKSLLLFSILKHLLMIFSK